MEKKEIFRRKRYTMRTQKKYILTRRYFVGNKSIFAKFVTCKSSNIKNIDLVAIKLPACHLFIYKYKRIDSITGI